MKSKTLVNTRLTTYYKKPASFSPQIDNGFYVRNELKQSTQIIIINQ